MNSGRDDGKTGSIRRGSETQPDAPPGSGGATVHRFHAMDALRSVMMLFVVIGHAMLPYTATRKPHMVADPEQSPVFDFMLFLGFSVTLPAFFFAAGFLAAAQRRRRGTTAFARNRVATILVPFLVVWLFLAPVTTAVVDFAYLLSVERSPGAAWQALVEDFRPEWSKIWHLWFLPVLLLCYLVWLGSSVAIAWLSRGRLPNRVSNWRQVPGGFGLVVVFSIPLVPIFFVIGTDLQSLLNIPAYFWFFCSGLFVYARQSLLAEFERYAWPMFIAGLCLGIATWAVLWPATIQLQAAPPGLAALLGVLRAFLSSFLVVGAVGLFFRYFGGGNPTIRYLSGASYWIYLLHFPLVRMSAGVLSLTQLPAALKLLITVAVVMAVLLATWEFLVRRTLLGKLLGGSGKS